MSLIVNIKKNLGTFNLNVNFETEGGVTCLLGASGSGKSMTLKCIAGLVKPDEGYIALDGTVLFDSDKGINLTPQERRVGYLFQNYALFPNMTVKQNLLCGMHAEKNKQIKEREMREMLSFLQLSGLENHYPHQLSGGQMQRAALGRILLNKPRLLMLDEPFSALDTYLKDKLVPQMRQLLNSFPYGVLMVTHSREEAYRLSDQAAVIDRGYLHPVQPIKKLFADPGTVQAALVTGCKNIVRAKKTGEYQVFVPEWQVTLTTARPVKDDIEAIGIRAHYYHTKTPANRQKIRFVSSLEEPFEMIIEFRYEHQSDDSPAIWWRLPKGERPKEFPEELGIAPANIMLLY